MLSVRELLPITPPSKLCPKCQAVVPIRLKVCKSCQHVFRFKTKAEQNMPDQAVKHMRVFDKLQKTTKRALETSEQTVYVDKHTDHNKHDIAPRVLHFRAFIYLWSICISLTSRRATKKKKMKR